jgi:ATP-dependent RNA helicase DeaD
MLTGEKNDVAVELTPEEPIRAKKRKDVRTAGRRYTGSLSDGFRQGGRRGGDYRSGEYRGDGGWRGRSRYSDRDADQRDRKADGRDKDKKRNGGYVNPF